MVQSFLVNYEKKLSVLGWLIFITIALLQIFKVRGGFITNYGADIIAPVMLYYWTRTNRGLFSKLSEKGLNEKQTLILLWALCILWETRQYFDLSTGTIDAWDILTYSLTLFICYYLDVTRVKEV